MDLHFCLTILYENFQMAWFPLYFSMVALCETRLSLQTFDFFDGALYRELNFAFVLLYNETFQIARFLFHFSMVVLYKTRLSVVTFEFCDGDITQRPEVRDSSLL